MFVPTNSRRAPPPKSVLPWLLPAVLQLPVRQGKWCEVYHRTMGGTGSELVDSSPADRLVAFDILVRSEPDDEEEEDEQDDGEDEDEGESDGNSDGYSE
jgi:hypothetical protein